MCLCNFYYTTFFFSFFLVVCILLFQSLAGAVLHLKCYCFPNCIWTPLKESWWFPQHSVLCNFKAYSGTSDVCSGPAWLKSSTQPLAPWAEFHIEGHCRIQRNQWTISNRRIMVSGWQSFRIWEQINSTFIVLRNPPLFKIQPVL